MNLLHQRTLTTKEPIATICKRFLQISKKEVDLINKQIQRQAA